MNEDLLRQVLRDYAALRRPAEDPELEAVRVAILLEGVLGVTLADADIDPAVLADPAAIPAVIARLRGAA